MKILIAGGTAQIAEALLRLLETQTDYEIVILTRSALDNIPNPRVTTYSCNILDYKKVKDLIYHEKPDAIVNTSGFSDLLLADKEKQLAQSLNVNAVENLVRIAKVLDCHYVQFSGDMIFDGLRGPYAETDTPNPINYLGKTMLSAENFCKSGHNKTTILRTSLVFGASSYGKRNIVTSTVKELQTGADVSLSSKIFQSSSFTDDIALSVFKVISRKKYGTYNISGSDILSQYEIGLLIAKIFDISTEHVKIKESANDKARIPEKCGLINLKAETDLNMKFSGFENAIMALRFQMNEISNNNYYQKNREK